MGYGHQRTAFPLKDLAPGGEIVNANDYPGIPQKDKIIWEMTRRSYELISKLKRIFLFGDFIFFIFDQFQKILSFYPKRDLSKPNFQSKQMFSLIRQGWGNGLVERLKTQNLEFKTNLPIIATFFTPAFMAEFFEYPGEIFCVICDADISRTWASFAPKKSKIKYFAPTERVIERLKLYGVRAENIFFTGYPLPRELIGDEKMEILKNDLENRILNLDPKKKYIRFYEPLIRKHLGYLPLKSDHLLTIMFAVGGAGAQKEIGIKIIKSLAQKIKNNEIKMILSTGTKKEVKEYFEKNIENLGLEKFLDKNIGSPSISRPERSGGGIEIIFEKNIESYFQKFNFFLRKTDVLWTKPSELSFYSALGIPIVIAPTIGSQEEFNKRWLLKSGFGILQENPGYAHQWLFDWLEKGYLAEAAMQGFIEGEKLGAIKIKEIISKCPGFQLL